MITNTADCSIIRLLLKIAGYIGHSCFKYISFLCDNNSLSRIELEILERIITMGLYSDEVIEAACFTALCENVTFVVDFNFPVDEVNNSFYSVE
jgi:hypothetical protein